MNDLSWLEGSRVIASISGGKDSAAMSLYLTELGIEHERVFMDTGWESPITYDYIQGDLTSVLGPITVLRPERDMVALIKHKRMFPSRLRRYCTDYLKMQPFRRYVRAIDDDVVNTVGIRAGESKARSKMPEREWSDGLDCEVWRPIIGWSEQNVIDIHHRHGLMPNPLYLKGARRVGCWPCVFARKSEIALMADIDPERVALIRKVEAEVSATVGEPRTFFHGNTTVEDSPIDDVIAWARTDRGGRQYPLFDLEEPGCVRWGLCGADDSPEAA